VKVAEPGPLVAVTVTVPAVRPAVRTGVVAVPELLVVTVTA
jgi:hypothetical protein